ncbi:helix-turn-helix transcriptional regulator [Krasilnikovia sp. MM14-A1259]|uniref:helix-turn-helix transcriptional regulator n=1 Tax=Krasilnikovia sp. MM14-A1259 TaxID=3373539 RepID=UPI0037F59F98
MRADRLLSLILLLQAHGRLAAPDLARRLEVSVRTVLRDVEALSAAGVPVYTERGRGGGIRLLDGYRAGLADLSRAEAASLVVGQHRLAADLGLADALDNAIEKIMGAGGQALRGGIEHGKASILVDVDPWMRSGEPVPLLPAVHDAVIRRRRADLEYADSRARARTVSVDPLGLVAKAGVWYLVALGAPRSAEPALFRVSRVRSCRIRDEPAARPTGFDLGAAWHTLRDRVEHRQRHLIVHVAVAAAELAMVRRLLADRITSGGQPQATVPAAAAQPRLRLRFAGTGEAVGALMGLGTRIEVLDPPELRAALYQAARELADLYTPGSAR